MSTGPTRSGRGSEDATANKRIFWVQRRPVVHKLCFFFFFIFLNIRQYFQGPAVKMGWVNTTKEHDMTVMKTVV